MIFNHQKSIGIILSVSLHRPRANNVFPVYSLSKEKNGKIFGFSQDVQLIINLGTADGQSDIDVNTIVTSCYERGVIGFDLFSDGKLLLIQRRWAPILSNMPAPLLRHKFAT